MKKLVVTILTLMGMGLSLQALAFVPNRLQKAELNICPAEAVGCAHTISIGGKTFPVDVDAQATEAMQMVDQLIAVHQLLELPNTAPFLAGGYFVFKGMFPNPMIEQLVFVITDIEAVIMPRALE